MCQRTFLCVSDQGCVLLISIVLFLHLASRKYWFICNPHESKSETLNVEELNLMTMEYYKRD